jgi:GAF domain-containing protein
MTFLKSILPTTVPDHLVGNSEHDIAREKILQSLLVTAGVMLFTVSVLSYFDIFTVFGSELPPLPIAGVSIILICLSLLRKLPYLYRVVPLLLFTFGMSVINLLMNGITGAGIAFLIAHSIIAGALLGKKIYYIVVVIDTLLYFVISVGMGRSIFPPQFPLQEFRSDDINSWTIVFTRFIILLAAISVAFINLLNGFEESLKKQALTNTQLENERESLALRVQERTERLHNRSEQLRAIADISRSMSSILDQEIMLQKAVNLLKERLDLYYAGIFIVEETGQFAVLKAGTGEAGHQMIENGHRLEVGGTSMIGWSISNRMPRIALDVGEEAVRFNNPILPKTRSELALPIITKNNAVGALTIQSTKSNAFDEDDILIFQGVADSFSIALENARLLKQTQDDLNEIRFLSRQYFQESWGSFMEASGAMTSEFENPLVRGTSTKTYSHRFPVLFREQPIGEIILETDEENLSSDDQQFIDSVTAQAVMSLESARLLQETRRQALQEEKINQISAQFTNAFDVRDVLETALKEISQLPSISEIAVHLVPPESQTNNNGSEVL